MTDNSPTPDDELASAYLDDDADDAERALVESNPDLLARADRLAGIRRALAATQPVPDPTQRDEHIANALAMLDVAAPISLADRRDQRLRRRLAALSAAAAIVAVVGVLAVASNRRDHDSLGSTAGQSAATTVNASGADSKSDVAEGATTIVGPSATTASGGAVPAPMATTPAAAGPPTTPASAPTFAAGPDLGFIDENSAPEVLRNAGDHAVPPPPACAVPAGTRYVGTATYAGTPVFAFVTAPDAPEQRGVLLDTRTCTVVADLRLT
jgi:hypothetical protein